jgi:hypothetical protein
MKILVLSAILAASFSASAMTCKVLEADGQEVSANSKIEAEKKAWNACIDKKLADREHRDGQVSVEAALADAEPCINSKIVCR